jgi:GDP-4-dehydro-6-deoxy-D-mannose reductase
MRILITGISGFAGRHLAELLARDGHAISGTVHHRASVARLLAQVGSHAGIGAEALHQLDIADGPAVAAIVKASKPDAIFHLAGTALVGGSDADPASVFSINALGTLHLLAAVRTHCPRARVVAVGSGSAYGLLDPAVIPVSEECPFRPLSAYGVSKAASDLIAQQWARAHGLDVVRVRPFNHIGPGQEPGFVCPDVAQQLVAVDRGPLSVRVGNVDVVRDFTDVRDVVAAYAAVLHHGQAGEVYNVCSGVGRTVRELIERMIVLSGVDAVLELDAERLRPADVPIAIGSARKLHDATGWQPQIPLEQSLIDVLADWRTRQ